MDKSKVLLLVTLMICLISKTSALTNLASLHRVKSGFGKRETGSFQNVSVFVERGSTINNMFLPYIDDMHAPLRIVQVNFSRKRRKTEEKRKKALRIKSKDRKKI